MIFMGNRRTKERKDAIAQGLGDIALVAMHGVHHQLQSGINNRLRLFGIEAFNQAVEPLRSANKAVIVFRSPSVITAARIRSARWEGV